jgi:hypothetical protein
MARLYGGGTYAIACRVVSRGEYDRMLIVAGLAPILWNNIYCAGYDFACGGGGSLVSYLHIMGVPQPTRTLGYFLRGVYIDCVDLAVTQGDTGPLRSFLYSIFLHVRCVRYAAYADMVDMAACEDDFYGVGCGLVQRHEKWVRRSGSRQRTGRWEATLA